ncbi:hypothetical protein SSS_10639 [Sarcoptes scabiei]|nr:hypothetical protein SSS_10639 [Sarcoptes scabiei]
MIQRKLESEQLDRQLRKRLVERINDFVLDEQTQPGPCWNVSFELEDYFREKNIQQQSILLIFSFITLKFLSMVFVSIPSWSLLSLFTVSDLVILVFNLFNKILSSISLMIEAVFVASFVCNIACIIFKIRARYYDSTQRSKNQIKSNPSRDGRIISNLNRSMDYSRPDSLSNLATNPNRFYRSEHFYPFLIANKNPNVVVDGDDNDDDVC